jgi:hypothetical protein
MHALSQSDCLELWESGRTLHPLDQSLLAVRAGFPEIRYETIADWPLGRRNRALAELHCVCFGRWLRGWTACRQCGDKLEFGLDSQALVQEHAAQSPQPVEVKGRVFRLPTSRDLAEIAAESDPSVAARRLLDHCLLLASSAAPSWTDAELESVGERMAAADPLAEIRLHFQCPVCGAEFDESLDLALFLWSELEGPAKRLLLDVHAPASAYGWSEPQVLSLSQARRDFYLKMVQA